MLLLEGENTCHQALFGKNVFINLNECLISARHLHNNNEIQS